MLWSQNYRPSWLWKRQPFILAVSLGFMPLCSQLTKLLSGVWDFNWKHLLLKYHKGKPPEFFSFRSKRIFRSWLAYTNKRWLMRIFILCCLFHLLSTWEAEKKCKPKPIPNISCTREENSFVECSEIPIKMLYLENNSSSLGKGFVVEITDFPNPSSEFMIHICEPSVRNRRHSDNSLHY